MIPQPTIDANHPPSSGPSDSFRTRPEVSLCLIDDEALLFDARHPKFYAANTTTAFIWCCLDDGLTPADIATKIEATFRVSLIEADRYLLSALQSWIQFDLVTDRTEPEAFPESTNTGFASSLLTEPLPAWAANSFRPVCEGSYRLLDTHFRLRFASVDAYRTIDMYLRPFAAPFPRQDVLENSATIDLIEWGNNYALVHNCLILEKWASRNEIVPIAKLVLITLALERSRDFGAVHAAGHP